MILLQSPEDHEDVSFLHATVSNMTTDFTVCFAAVISLCGYKLLSVNTESCMLEVLMLNLIQYVQKQDKRSGNGLFSCSVFLMVSQAVIR